MVNVDQLVKDMRLGKVSPGQVLKLYGEAVYEIVFAVAVEDARKTTPCTLFK